MSLSIIRCPICGAEVTTSGSSERVVCPNGHLIMPDDVVLDCEIRDWERFGLLPVTAQETVLEAIQGGRIPKELIPLMTRLKEAGVVVCT